MQDRHHYPAKEFDRLFDDIDMAEVNRVETAWVQRDTRGHLVSL